MTDFRSYQLWDLEKIPDPCWMIPNMIREKSLTMLYGATGAGKTFVALEIALCLAHGLSWAGNTGPVQKAYRVAYFAGEGCHGLRMRILAWLKFHNIDRHSKNFVLFDGIPPIGTVGGVNDLHSRVYHHWIEGADLCVIDTVMRGSAGIDLNSPSGSQAFIDGCDEIRRQFDGSVLLIHHTGKNEGRGPLGAENIRAAVDNLERVVGSPHSAGERVIKLIQEKNKDGELRSDIRVALMPVEVKSCTETSELTTLVAVPASGTSKGAPTTPTEKYVRLAKEVLEADQGHAFKTLELAKAVLNRERGNNIKTAIRGNADSVRRLLTSAAGRGEFSNYARKGVGGTAAWLFEANKDNLEI